MGRRLTTTEYLKSAVAVHGETYDYTRTVYSGATGKITIGCSNHGWFEQAPYSHLNGRGCPGCGKKKRARSSSDEFIEKSHAVHGSRYDYSRVHYRGATERVTIVCTSHGEFEQTPAGHLSGYGCPQCGILQRVSKRTHDLATVVKKARAQHGNRYGYDRAVYRTGLDKLTITCSHHGDFEQTPGNHLTGHGCPQCGGKVQSNTPEFVAKAENVHGAKFDYTGTDYVKALEKVEIKCIKHGVFNQTPADHLTGYGCPTCGRIESEAEREIYDFVNQIVPAERRNREILGNRELDIWVPERNLAIEYCGLYWHTEERGKDRLYHWDKYERCRKQGIRLLTVFEDEWLERPTCVRGLIQNALGATPRGPGARSLRVEEIGKKLAGEFCDLNHVQGRCQISTALGAFLGDHLVGVMIFAKPSRQSGHPVELRRFCSTGSFPGLGSKMFQTYIREHQPQSVVSFSDNRLFLGGLYERMGFTRDGDIPPDYAYVGKKSRINKSRFRTSRLRQVGFPRGSESEIMFGLQYDRIWDCGKTRWAWNS